MLIHNTINIVYPTIRLSVNKQYKSLCVFFGPDFNSNCDWACALWNDVIYWEMNWNEESKFNGMYCLRNRIRYVTKSDCVVILSSCYLLYRHSQLTSQVGWIANRILRCLYWMQIRSILDELAKIMQNRKTRNTNHSIENFKKFIDNANQKFNMSFKHIETLSHTQISTRKTPHCTKTNTTNKQRKQCHVSNKVLLAKKPRIKTLEIQIFKLHCLNYWL